jgi:hypothetical protein
MSNPNPNKILHLNIWVKNLEKTFIFKYQILLNKKLNI